MTESNEDDLLQLLKLGNEDAFQQIFHKYAIRCCGIAMKYLQSEALAVDVVEKTFSSLWLERKTITEINTYIFNKTKDLTMARLHKLAKEYLENRKPGESTKTDQ